VQRLAQHIEKAAEIAEEAGDGFHEGFRDCSDYTHQQLAKLTSKAPKENKGKGVGIFPARSRVALLSPALRSQRCVEKSGISSPPPGPPQRLFKRSQASVQ
jgi:hypothetical protein